MAKKKPKRQASKPARKPPTLGPIPEPAMKELELAYDRINGNSIRRLRWLLNFAYGDFDKLSEGKKVDVGWELAAFALPDNPRRLSPDALLDASTILWDDKVPEHPNVPVLILQDPKPSLVLVRSFQEQMKKDFETLYSGEWLAFTYPQKIKRIAIPHLSRKPDMWEALAAHELLKLRAFELLEAEKDRLWVCENPNCKKKFVSAKQGRTRFHSPTCSAYVRIRRSRGKPVELGAKL
jgi:hypothetical protein